MPRNVSSCAVEYLLSYALPVLVKARDKAWACKSQRQRNNDAYIIERHEYLRDEAEAMAIVDAHNKNDSGSSCVL